MTISTSLFLIACVGCQPSTTAPTQLVAEAPQTDAPAPIVDAAPLQLARAEKNNAVVPDGVVAVEWSARSRESDPATLLRRGSQGAAVKRLQARLARLGYLVTLIDGKFGPQTQVAVIQFQRANGLIADGMIDASTWAKLNVEITQSGVVPLSKPPQQVIQRKPPVLASPSAAFVAQPTTADPEGSPVSSKKGWIVVLIILQGAGWLVILQGLNKELVLLTGRSLFPGKTTQWLFSPKH